MQPTTISRILPLVAKELGKDEECDREEILDEIHECRSLMFSSLGEEVRQAFFLRDECVEIREFWHDCRHRCSSRYFGVSLPEDVIKAEVFRIDGCRIRIEPEFSHPVMHWWNHCFCDTECIRGVDLGDGWPLPVDPCKPFNLGFRLASDMTECDPEEEEKKELVAGVSYDDLNGTHQREDVPLRSKITYASQTVSMIHHRGITLPPGRKSVVEIYEEDKMIATVHPSIDVPNYRRIALSLPEPGTRVEIEDALHCPARAVFDTDPVETGDPIFWRNMLQMKSLHFKTKRTASEERAYGSTLQILISQARQTLAIKEPDTFIPVVEPVLPYRRRQLQSRYPRTW